MSNYLTGLAQLNPQVKRHNGGTATLTLDENGTTNATMLYVNGVAQTPGIDFNVSGTTLTCTSTLPAGTNIATTIQYFNTGIVNTPADATVTDAKANFVSTSSAAGLQIKGDGTTDGTLQLNCSQNSHGIKIKSPPHSASASYTLTMPNDDGDANEFLQTNGSGVLDWASAGGGWEYVGIVTASSSSTLDFTNMTTGYDWRYEIQNLLPNTNQVYYKGYLGVAGPTYRTSSYKDMATGVWEQGSSAGTVQTTDMRYGYVQVGSGTDKGMPIMVVTLYDPANASTDTVYTKHGQFRYYYNTQSYAEIGGGSYTTAEAHTSIRFFPSSGNFVSGIIKQYRRKNA